MTTGAPKTVSVGAVIFKSELIREAYRRAHQKLVREAETLTGRQAHNGKDHIYRTENFCALDYEHTSNRCLEPQLHDHLLIINATKDPKDGRNYAIEFGELARQCPYLTAVGADALAYELRAIGAEIEIDEFGMPQIVAFRELAEIYSERTKQIEALIDKIEEHAGTKLSDREAKTISLGSRGFDIAKFERLWQKNKARLDGLKTLDPEKAGKARREILDNFTAIVRDSSQDRLLKRTAAEVEAGQQALLTHEQRVRGAAYVAGLKRVEVQDRSQDIAADITFTIEHIFANKSVVKEYDLWEQILLHAQGKNVDLARMKAEVRADRRLVFGLSSEVGTAEHYKRELEMLLWIEEGKGRGVSVPAHDLNVQLTHSQRQAVKERLKCRDQFGMLYGIHGAGKTFALAEVTRRYLEQGRKVMVLAPENGARDVLREDGLKKIPSGQTADVFQRAENLAEFLVNKKLNRGLGPGDLVILDEAGMSNLEDLNNFMRLVRDRGCQALISGDDGQLTSVAAGDGFRILKDRSSIQVSELKEIIRQTPEALEGHYLKAAQLLGEKKKRVREAMWELYQAGCVKEIKGQARIEYYADRVIESLDGIKPAVMSNITHRENDAVAEIVRARCQEGGELADERTFTVHRTLGWSSAQKKEIDKLQPGQILQITRGADKGRAWKVLEVRGGKAITEDPSGQRREFSKTHAGMFEVCEQREMPVALGDHLRLYSGGKQTTNGELFIPVAWDVAGNPVNADGKALTSRNFNYGYTGTVRKVQGATKPKDIWGLDRKSIRAATAEIATVACTRGREDVEIIVESIADIAQIENKSSQRKAVCEMALDPSRELQAEIRDIFTRIEQAKASQLVTKEQIVSPEKRVVDLQERKRQQIKQELKIANHMQQRRDQHQEQHRGIER